jgi:hypothetical protein
MRGPRAILLAGLLLALAAAPARSALRFDAEVIRLEIRGDTLRVDGTYHFVDPEHRPSTALFYPYPEDSLLGAAWTESLAWHPADDAPWQALPIRERPERSGVGWLIRHDGAERFTVRTVYCQRLRTRYARYIVTTTNAWGRPLRSARFELMLPPGMELIESSFPFEREGEIWVFSAEDFLPAKDVVVRWAPAP